jgi:hypothetical protein
VAEAEEGRGKPDGLGHQPATLQAPPQHSTLSTRDISQLLLSELVNLEGVPRQQAGWPSCVQLMAVQSRAGICLSSIAAEAANFWVNSFLFVLFKVLSFLLFVKFHKLSHKL